MHQPEAMSAQAPGISVKAPRSEIGVRSRQLNYDVASSPGGTGFTFLGASALSISQTTLVIADDRVLASPDLTVFASSWTVHFQESGPTPWTMVKCLPRYSILKLSKNRPMNN
jgi:hypothetical protein